MKTASRQTLRNKADKLFSEFIREAGSCEHCGRREALQAAHIHSRKFNSTRFDPLNAVCLCAKCHLWAHAHPTFFTDWLKNYLGEEIYAELERTAKTKIVKTTPEFYRSIIERLTNRESPYVR